MADPTHVQPILDQGKPLLDQYAHLIPPLILAMLGGVARALVGRKAGCAIWRVLLDACIRGIVAVFVGAVIGLCLEATEWHWGFKGGVIGLSGWMGTDLLSVMAEKYLNTVKKCSLQDGK